MPEKVHTRFNDQVKPSSLDTNALGSSKGISDEYAQGVKRSRDGSPKALPRASSLVTYGSVSAGADSTVHERSQTDDIVIQRRGEGIATVDKVSDPFGKRNAEKNKKITVAPSTFYNGVASINGAHSGKAISNAATEDKLTTKSAATGTVLVSKNNTKKDVTSRSVNGTKSNGTRKSSIDSSQSNHTVGSPMHKVNRLQLERTSKFLYGNRQKLPIWNHRADIRWGLRQSDILLLVGETGSGKSTQVPQFLTDEPWFKKEKVSINGKEVWVGGQIAITEPRRVAAKSLAQRVAKERGVHLGPKSSMNEKDDVGYSVRFDTAVPTNARIKYLTEGMLLQELLHDPHLRRYSAVIIDEIHERSVDVDLVAGFLKNLVLGDKIGRGGKPLKLVIMSATANMEGLQNFFSKHSEPENLILRAAAVNDTEKQSALSNDINLEQERVNGRNSSLAQVNADEPLRSRNRDVRKQSDASYSSWEGITSDDDSGSNIKSTPATGSFETLEVEESQSGLLFASSNSGGSSQIKEKGVTVHYITGNQYDVDILYTPVPVSDYSEAMLKTIFQIHTKEPLPGDILAFLTGQEEIETMQQLVEQLAAKLSRDLPRIDAVPLYGQLSMDQQSHAFMGPKNPRNRKVILATNIAETSVTVPGVRYVIDCGKAKVKQFRSRLGLESLLVTPISKSSAIQRKGRAGREAKGKCYRLYTENEYLKLRDADLPEILRSDVAEAVLKMKARGVEDVLSFPLMDSPDIDAMEKALFDLHAIGALGDDGSLNETGRKMSQFPLSAHFGRVLVAASDLDSDCLLDAIDAIACLTASEDIFMQPKTEEVREEVEENRRDIFRREGDILTYLTTIQKYCSEQSNRDEWCRKRLISSTNMKQALRIRTQLRQMCHKADMLTEKPPTDPQPFVPITTERGEMLLKCFMKAFMMKTASLQPDNSYATTQGKNIVTIHPSSVLHGQKREAIMFLEHVYTQKNYAKKVSAIQMNWIAEALDI